jgi:hypothetical protein
MLEQILDIYNERIWLGWTEAQAKYYVDNLTVDLIKSWKPINTIWSHL